MQKPIIGLMPLWDEEKQSYWMLPGYMKGIAQAGGVAIMLPLEDEDSTIEKLVDMCDGFLFTGGQDVSPEIYGKTKEVENLECCIDRDKMEVKLLSKAIEENKSILGICRGLQFINAALGGSLYQDLPTQNPSQINHRQQPPYDKTSHNVKIKSNTPLKKALNKEIIGVNSCHHQAIKELSISLEDMATSEDGIIEAVYMPSKKFVWAVQWHPEFLFEKDENSQIIFKHFVNSCK